MSNKDLKLEQAYNSIAYDGDTMPELSYEEGTGYYFSGYINSESLKAFADANGLDTIEQAYLESFIDKSVCDN